MTALPAPLTGPAGIAVVVVVALALVAAVAAVGVAVRTRRAARRELAARDTALAASQGALDDLSRRVEGLADEVAQSRQAVAEREYVITTLASELTEPDLPPRRDVVAVPARPGLVRTVGAQAEERIVAFLGSTALAPRVRAGVTEGLVRGVALAHGVRRALSADVLDRAAAEAHVARRRSRRIRRQELREAQRLLRQLKVQRRGQEPAA